VNIQEIQQRLNQINQICNQLSQSEQTNISHLNQLSQNERAAAQQLQQCMQLISQVSQQIQQISAQTTTQYTSPGQFSYSVQQPMGGSQFGMGQQSFSPSQFGTTSSYEFSKEFASGGENDGDGGAARGFSRAPQFQGSSVTGQQTYNTNKDLGK
jgi:hypothetical protein